MSLKGMTKRASQGRRLRRAGLTAWAILGIAGVLVLAGYLASLLALILVPMVLALFPATLLEPVARRVRGWGVPRTLAALGTLLAGLLLVGGLLAGTVGLVVSGAPEVTESVGEGLERLEELVGQVAPGASFQSTDDLLEMLNGEEGSGALAGRAMRMTLGVFEAAAGGVLFLVILFFYLHSGRRMLEGVTQPLPAHRRERTREQADVAWSTLGRFFRGQIVVALADGIFIGLGLVLLGVPLALPLAVLTFFGGLFPIVGALVTGAVAILVALAHGGLTLALLVTGLVILVQQLESNVLAPLVLGRAIDLHPLAVILSVTAGGLLLGVLGAFLAVPVAAVVRAVWLHGQVEGDAWTEEDDPGVRETRRPGEASAS
jgi:predicted PurR-regulated permease PerM